MSKKLESLIEDACKAGYEIKTDGPNILIYKNVKCGRINKRIGIIIYEEGWAYRLDIPAELTKGIRSYAVMRGVLGI